MTDVGEMTGQPASIPAPQGRLRRVLQGRALWPILALLVILTVVGSIVPGFFTIRLVEGRLFGNLIDILYRAVPTAMVAVGMAVVIGTRGIDLSVGAIAAIAGAVIAWRIQAGDPHGLVLIWALGAAILCGIWNGTLVAFLGIQPIIATLILMVSGRGIGMLINLLYGGTDPSFQSAFLQGLSTGSIFYVPTRLYVFAALFLLLWLLIRRTALGLFVEATGANAAASDIAGVNAKLVTFVAYVLCALMAGWAGVILTADTHTSDPVSVALYIELDAILAVVIGGASLAGGRIYLGLTVIGALVIQALTTSILISGLPPEYNLIIKALVVLFVLVLQSDKARQELFSSLRRTR
jgi:simple sugar transport system permease protein